MQYFPDLYSRRHFVVFKFQITFCISALTYLKLTEICPLQLNVVEHFKQQQVATEGIGLLFLTMSLILYETISIVCSATDR